MSDDTIDLSLLDKNLSEIEDLPSFEVPPKGTYIFLVSMGTKTINDKAAVTADFSVISTIQLAEPNDPTKRAVKDGSTFNTMYMLGNEYGMGNLKKFLAPFAEKFGTDNLRELVTEKVQNVQISANLDHRVDKEDKTKIYPIVKNIVVQ